MARLRIEIVVDDWTVEQLKQAVRDLDVLEDDVPIAIDQVDAWDVVSNIVTNRLGVDFQFYVNEMVD